MCPQILAAANGCNSQSTGCHLVQHIYAVHCAGVTNISPHYNLSPTVKTHRQQWHMRSGSTCQKDYRLVWKWNDQELNP